MSSESNLIWIDLEMTGLVPEKETILEIATIVTDSQLNILEEGPVFAIHQSDEILAGMDEWNTSHHNASGLVQRVRESTVDLAQAESKTFDFIKKYTTNRKSPLCGNSIGQDRMFLRLYMPRLEAFLHYRNVDVSTIKEVVRRWYPESLQAPKKQEVHLAMQDIRESIEELKFYKEHVFVKLES